jgi:hypothetical protein
MNSASLGHLDKVQSQVGVPEVARYRHEQASWANGLLLRTGIAVQARRAQSARGVPALT